MTAVLPDYVLAPWGFRLDATPVLVRPAQPRDLPAVARMHRRCTARTLLDRFRQGGQPPSAAALDAELRNPHCFVALTPGGDAIAVGGVRRDPQHDDDCAIIDLLVEDKWQQRGLGSALTSHLAGVAHAAGYAELIAYPATAIAQARRLMTEVGRSRMVPTGDAHLHTYLSESATLGLGSVRQRLAG